jgi:hypothetical protein
MFHTHQIRNPLGEEDDDREDQSATARLPPGGVMKDVDVHSVLRKQDIPYH